MEKLRQERGGGWTTSHTHEWSVLAPKRKLRSPSKNTLWVLAMGRCIEVMKGFARLASLAVVATYALIILGGLVRTAGAGLACPDWPLCHGRLIPPLDPLVLIEWSHRFVASIVGLLTLAVGFAAWRLRRAGQPGFVGLSALALVLVVIQIGLGGLTVRHELTAWLIVAHLGTAMAFFATLIIIGVIAVTPTPAELVPSGVETRARGGAGQAAPRRHDSFRA